jgi:hypothetical protein
MDPPDFTIRANDPVFLLEGVALAFDGGAVGISKRHAVLGMDKAQHLVGGTGEMRRRAPK